MAIFAPQVVTLVGAPDATTTTATPALSIRSSRPPPARPRSTIFGVDQLGRDVFIRVVYGARVSLIVAFASTFIATILGVIAGLIAGYFRGWIDTFISRSVDVLLAIPYLLLATGLAARRCSARRRPAASAA